MLPLLPSIPEKQPIQVKVQNVWLITSQVTESENAFPFKAATPLQAAIQRAAKILAIDPKLEGPPELDPPEPMEMSPVVRLDLCRSAKGKGPRCIRLNLPMLRVPKGDQLNKNDKRLMDMMAKELLKKGYLVTCPRTLALFALGNMGAITSSIEVFENFVQLADEINDSMLAEDPVKQRWLAGVREMFLGFGLYRQRSGDPILFANAALLSQKVEASMGNALMLYILSHRMAFVQFNDLQFNHEFYVVDKERDTWSKIFHAVVGLSIPFISGSDVKTVLHYSRTLNKVWPMRMGRISFVDTPWQTKGLWKFLKLAMPESWVASIWMPSLKEFKESVTFTNMPPWLGGRPNSRAHTLPLEQVLQWQIFLPPLDDGETI